jgi:hypothetical protein
VYAYGLHHFLASIRASRSRPCPVFGGSPLIERLVKPPLTTSGKRLLTVEVRLGGLLTFWVDRAWLGMVTVGVDTRSRAARRGLTPGTPDTY